MGTEPSFFFMVRELGEVFDTIARGGLAEVIDEIGDVLFFFWALVALWFGLEVRALGAARCWRKVEARRAVWVELFAREGLTYHPRFTSNGTNHERPEKVRAALEEARRELAEKSS